jgi:hypothetical protein
MSEKNEKTKKPVNTASVVPTISAPSQGWKQKLFGPAMSDQSIDQNPEIAKSFAGRSVEFPEAAKNTMSVKPMSTLRKMLSGNAYGFTSPLGQISINLDQIRADQQNIDDVMAHEMEHANQGIGGYIRNMFGIGNDEEKAINKEAMRNVRRTDIPLRPPMSAPSVSTRDKIVATRVKK